MSAILKTLPVRFARGELKRFFGMDGKPCFTIYYFTLGRGRPKQSNPTEIDLESYRGTVGAKIRL